MRHILLAPVCNASVYASHLQGSNQDVTLADSDIGHIATVPSTVRLAPAREILRFPLGIGNATCGFAAQIHTRRRAKSPAAIHFLQSLGIIFIVEKALSDVVKHGVAGMDDTVTKIHRAVTGMEPAPLAIRFAKTSPPATAHRCLCLGENAMFESSQRRKRLDGRRRHVLTGDSTIDHRQPVIFAVQLVPHIV